MHCVYAGLEPLAFTNHFPHWEVYEEATNANTEENRPSRLEDMQSCFTQLSKSVYTFEELQQRPLPDGVNPNKLETYLSDEQFMVRLQFHCYLRRHSCSNYAVGYIVHVIRTFRSPTQHALMQGTGILLSQPVQSRALNSGGQLYIQWNRTCR